MLLLSGFVGTATVLVLAAGDNGSEEIVITDDEETTPEPVDDGTPVNLSPSELGQEYGDAVWSVESEGCGVVSGGTAFAIDDRLLVTNWHVTSMDPEPTLVSRDGQTRISGTVRGWTDWPDLAIIEVDTDLPMTLEFTSADDLDEGQQLTAIGYPMPEGDFAVTSADVLSFQVADGERQAIRADGAVDRGNSGGPALTADGKVAGVVTEVMSSGGLQIFALFYTHDFLSETIDDLRTSTSGVEVDCSRAGLPQQVPDGWDWDDGTTPGPGHDPTEAFDYGDDPTLDQLWDDCAAEDWEACDELYFASPLYSEYERFGATCGEEGEGWGMCAYLMDADGGWPSPGESVDDYGDDEELDALWDRCADEDWEACDELYFNSPFSSEYERFGSTCGEATDPSFGLCDHEMNRAVDYGDDPELDELWDRCADEDWESCDELYFASPFDTEYESFGASCGERMSGAFGTCAWQMADDGP